METFDKIERYLLGQLSPEEAGLFEKEMAADAALRAEVDAMRDMILSIEYAGLKSNLQAYKIEGAADTSPKEAQPRQGEAKRIGLFSRKIIAIAAGLALLITAGIFALRQDGSDIDKLFYADPGLPTVMSETKQYEFYDAMVDYKMGKYELALEKWGRTAGIGADTLAYYRAMAMIQLEDFAGAEEKLRSIPDSSSLAMKADWYLVYVLLQSDRREEAKTLLKQLPDTLHGYEKVLKKLR